MTHSSLRRSAPIEWLCNRTNQRPVVPCTQRNQSQADGNQQQQASARARRRTSIALGGPFSRAEPAAAVLLLLQLLGAVLAVPWQRWRYLQDDGGGAGGGGGGGGGGGTGGSRQPVEEQVAGVYTPLDSDNADSDTGGTAPHAPHRVS